MTGQEICTSEDWTELGLNQNSVIFKFIYIKTE
jgi:hypothetical protein